MLRALLCLLILLCGCSYGSIHVANEEDREDSGQADGGGRGSDAGPDSGDAELGEGPAADGGDAGSSHDKDSGLDDADSGFDAGLDAAGADAAFDAGDDAGPDAGAMQPFVQPVYAQAPRWTDRLRGADVATVCKIPEGLSGCFHAGELRMVVLPDETSCTGLTATDTEDWYDWTCVSDEGVIGMYSGQLHDELRLQDLLDVPDAEWKSNAVTVKKNGTLLFKTASAPFWDNPVYAISNTLSASVQDLDEAYAVYVVNGAAQRGLRIVEDHVSLVIADGMSLSGGPSNKPLLEATGRMHLWIEGGELSELRTHEHSGSAVDLDVVFSFIDGLGTQGGLGSVNATVDLHITAQGSRITDLASLDAASTGVVLAGNDSYVAGVTASGAQSTCIKVVHSWSRLYELRAEGCGKHGIHLASSHGLLSSGFFVTGAQDDGIRMEYATIDLHDDVTVIDGAGDGIVLAESLSAEPSQNCSLSRVQVYGNAGTGVVMGGADLRLIAATVAGNGGDGVRIEGSSPIVAHATIAMNEGVGLSVSGNTADATLVDVVSTNNEKGLLLGEDTGRSHVHSLFVTDNDTDVEVRGEDSLFTGTLHVGSETSCVVDAGLVSPGLSAAPCAVAGASTATIAWPATTSSAFVARVTTDDPLNPHALDASDTFAYDDITSWGFSTPLRMWGRDGTYGAAAVRGTCKTGERCAVWDFRVRALGPLVDPIPTTAMELGDAKHALTHTWSATTSGSCGGIANASWNAGTTTCSTRFLDYGLIVITYHVQDGLCGPGEQECLMARNRGSYYGAGALGTLFSSLAITDFGTIKLTVYSSGSL